MADNMNIVTYGGIKFKQDEIKNVRITNDYNMSGSLFTVETTHGTFSYREFPNNIQSGTQQIERKIFGSSIQNCTLDTLTGTNKSDAYRLNNSYIGTLDLSGDRGNEDNVYMSHSRIERTKIDSDDNIIKWSNSKWQ